MSIKQLSFYSFFSNREKKKKAHVHQLVLIGGDGDERRFREDERSELFGLETREGRKLRGAAVSPLHDVEPRLILVHGVEDYLQEQESRALIIKQPWHLCV